MSAFAAEIAAREAELRELETLKRQVTEMESRPTVLRSEIDELRRTEQEQIGAARAQYTNTISPYVEARDAALALVPQLADAIEQALVKRAELEATYRALVNLGLEPDAAKPDRVEIMQARDRNLQKQFVRLMAALAGRF